MIETYGYARAGFLGNPSDGYFGKTISFAMSNFRARVLIYPSGRLEIKPSKADLPVFENLDDLYRITRWRGYYGGIRIIQALIVRLIDYCREQGRELPDRNFTLEYESNVPQRLGSEDRSAIITASCGPCVSTMGSTSPSPFRRTWCSRPRRASSTFPRDCRIEWFRRIRGWCIWISPVT